MTTIAVYIKDLEKRKSTPGYKQKNISIPTNDGLLDISLYGPADFLTRMPDLIQKVAKSYYNKSMFAALAKANKPFSIIYTADRSLLGGGALPKPKPWYCFLCADEVAELMLLFNTAGFHEKIHLEVKLGREIVYQHRFDAIKYSLAHEFFHLWQFIDINGTPKIGPVSRSMYTQKLRNECWATRYTNGWRYREIGAVRYIYQHEGKKYKVDSISNHR